MNLKDRKQAQEDELDEETEALTDVVSATLDAAWEQSAYLARSARVTESDRINIPLDCLFALAATTAEEYGVTRKDFLSAMGEAYDSAAEGEEDEEGEALRVPILKPELLAFTENAAPAPAPNPIATVLPPAVAAMVDEALNITDLARTTEGPTLGDQP